MLKLSKLERSLKMMVFLRHFLSVCSCITLKFFRNAVCVYALILFLAYLLIKRVRVTAYALEKSIINAALLSHQWSKVCSQKTMPGDRNSILCSQCLSFTFGWGYCRIL